MPNTFRFSEGTTVCYKHRNETCTTCGVDFAEVNETVREEVRGYDDIGNNDNSDNTLSTVANKNKRKKQEDTPTLPFLNQFALQEQNNKLKEEILKYKYTHPLDLLKVNEINAIAEIEQLEVKIVQLMDAVKRRKISLQENQIQQLKLTLLCPICLDKNKSICLNPCGHLLCDNCFLQFQKKRECPTCRQPINGTTKVNL